MNNKHKLKRIKWGTLITIICLIGFILLNTSAKSLNSAKVKKVADKNKCTGYKLADFNPKITVESKNNQLTLSINIQKNKNARFWLFISRGSDMEGNIEFEATNDISDSYNATYSLLGLPIEEFYAVMVYKDGIDGSCGTTTQEIAEEIAKDYISNSGKFSDTIQTEIDKNYYIAKGTLKLIEVSSEEAIAQDDNYVSEKEAAAEQEANKPNESESSDYAQHDTTGISKADNTNLGSLYCNKNDLYKVGKTSGDDYYKNTKNTKKYYHEETTSTTTCSTTCKETITVQYGPPVAVKAGMCFEYKVKVESKVSCKAKYTGPSKPTKPALCSIKASCNNSATYFDQAGPDDEFDTCINTCDGGKYSQKCINSCYKKVYDSTNTKKISYENIEKTAEVKFMADRFTTNSINLSTDSNFCNSNNNPKSYSENYTNLVNAMRNNDKCEYKYDKLNKKIYWSCSTAKNSSQSTNNWSALGKYYFSTDAKATQTLQSVATSCMGEPGRAKYYHYYIDNQGFKRACFNTTKNNNTNCTRSCDEACTWEVGTGNVIMDGGNSSGNCYVSVTERNEAYDTALNKYIADKNACMAKASCSTKVAEFTISADNKVEGTTNTSTFGAKSTTAKSFTVTNTLSPIIASDGCYNSNNDKDNYYMAEWSFPGSWRNNKNGQISQTKPSNTNGWSQIKNYFCTSLKSDAVNSAWWNWAQNTKLASDTNYDTATYSGDITTYNITASTKDFGYFNWSLDIKCFYAISDSTCTEDDDCDSVADLDYQARSVDDDELFPSSSRDPENTGTKNIGFNWTSAANENIGDSKYEIQPEELLKDIEDENTYENDKLEYYFKLGKNQLNKLRNAKTNMTDFGGTFEEIKNIGKSDVKTYSIWRYKSNIIDNDSYVGTHRINRTKFCNNWVDDSTCKTY